MMRIVRGIRPERPHNSHTIGFIDPVWAIVEGCWKENRHLRPDVSTVVGSLVAAAAQWTPTPPLDDLPTADESETFSLISLYCSSECTHTSGKLLRVMDRIGTYCNGPASVTPRLLNCGEDSGKDETVAPPHYQNSVAENLRALAERFYGYYQTNRQLVNLDWAIRHEKEAVVTYLPAHPGRLSCLIRLAGYYYERHEVSRDLRDIELSIEKSSDVEQRTSEDDQFRPDALLILAKAHHVYYCRNLQPENLESAIKHSSEAATLCPVGHPFRAESLIILSVALHDRYQTSLSWGGFQAPHNDLDDAISGFSDAIELIPSDDPRLPHSHAKLSTFLFARYQRQKSLNDLRQSVHHARLASTGCALERRPEALIHLGHLLTYLSHDAQTLTELAKCSREALDLLPPNDFQRTGAIHNLVTASHRMYVTLNSVAHLDEAIDYNRLLLRLLPYGSEPRRSQLQLHHTLLEYRLNEKQLEVDYVEMINAAREIAMGESQSHRGYRHPAQPSARPPPIPGIPRDNPPIAPPPRHRPPQHWSPRPYYYDDSAISATDSDHTTTSSVETGNYGSGSESSLVGHTLNLSFVGPDSNRY